jgi:MSHA biogenesis protein MshN
MSLINQVLQDLEKRHASESELKSLPPYVRAVPGRPRSPVRAYVVAATFVAVLIAVSLFIYDGRRAPENDAPQIVVKPILAPLPAPVSVAKPPVAPQAALPPAAEQPAQSAAFNPVSRLSDELSLVAPLSVRKENPATAGRSAKPGVASSLTKVVPAALPQAEKPQASAVETAAKIEAPDKPAAVVPERVATPAAVPSAAAERAPGAIDKQMREVAPPERAEIAFRRGVAQLQEGRANAAESDFRDALKQDPSHPGARQALLGLLLDSGRNNEAEQLLRKALDINPRQPRYAMVLARLEVERGEVTGAINTMVGALPYVQSDPDFHAFLAALLQREGRHREAVDYYRTALRGVPGNGVWMMGLGISLRAANQSAEARDAFQGAIESKQLTPELQEFVERQLRELSAQKKK